MHDETLMKVGAVATNLVLMLGVLSGKPSLFLPWMLLYGAELAASWMVGLIFVAMQGVFLPAGLITLLRALIITYCWKIVRRHMKEVSEMANRPQLQTIFSIMTAHPFSPRPTVELSEQPPLPVVDT